MNPTQKENVSYADTNNPKISEGIVIADDDENEFVWVPVDNISSMVYCQKHKNEGRLEYSEEEKKLVCSICKEEGIETNFAGKLYATSKGDDTFNSGMSPNVEYDENSGLREPSIISSRDTDAQLQTSLEMTLEEFRKELQEEFNEMAGSVAKYGGFYIGRYETSLSNGKSGSKAGVQSLRNDSDAYNWYGQYKYNKKYAPKEENLSVVSNTIWGSEYDAMMKWMQANGVKVKDTIPKEGIEKNTDSYRITGAIGSKDKLCNIYDLLGNSYEWTMEAYDTYARITRGGSINYDSPPSSVWNYAPEITNNDLSARLSLYINLKTKSKIPGTENQETENQEIVYKEKLMKDPPTITKITNEDDLADTVFYNPIVDGKVNPVYKSYNSLLAVNTKHNGILGLNSVLASDNEWTSLYDVEFSVDCKEFYISTCTSYRLLIDEGNGYEIVDRNGIQQTTDSTGTQDDLYHGAWHKIAFKEKKKKI